MGTILDKEKVYAYNSTIILIMQERIKSFLPRILQRREHQPRMIIVQGEPPTAAELPHPMKLSQLKMQIDMGAYFAITKENYPDFPDITIGIANYYARSTEISMLEHMLSDSHADTKLTAQLQSQIFQLRNTRDEMMAAHLPPATEEFQKDGKQSLLVLTDQEWSTINTVINAGLVDELKLIPFFEKLAPETRRSLTIYATSVALQRETASEEQFKEKERTIGFRGEETSQTETEQRIRKLQQKGRELMGGVSANDPKEI